MLSVIKYFLGLLKQNINKVLKRKVAGAKKVMD